MKNIGNKKKDVKAFRECMKDENEKEKSRKE